MFYFIVRFVLSLRPIQRAGNGFWLFMFASLALLGAFFLLTPEQLSEPRIRQALAWFLPWAFAMGFCAPTRSFDAPGKALASGLAFGIGTVWGPLIWAAGRHPPMMLEFVGLGLAIGWPWALARHLTLRVKNATGGVAMACLSLVSLDGDGSDAAKAVAEALLSRWPELASRAHVEDFDADGGMLRFDGIPELWLEMSNANSDASDENDETTDAPMVEPASQARQRVECLLTVVWHPDARLLSFLPNSRPKLDPMALRDGLCAAMREGFPQFEPRPVG
jgi:hypothetical protein